VSDNAIKPVAITHSTDERHASMNIFTDFATSVDSFAKLIGLAGLRKSKVLI
jgi:hypothetical protein